MTLNRSGLVQSTSFQERLRNQQDQIAALRDSSQGTKTGIFRGIAQESGPFRVITREERSRLGIGGKLLSDVKAAANIGASFIPSVLIGDIPAIVAESETGMGFFSSAFKFIKGAASSLLGLGAPAARAAVQVVKRAPIRSALAAGAVGLGIAGAAGAFTDAEGNPVIAPAAVLMQAGGGNGTSSKVTVVMTIDNASGAILRQKILKGAPFLMRKDLSTSKKVDSVLRRASNKFRAQSRGPSKTKMLTDAVMDNALKSAIVGPAVTPLAVKC